MRITAGHELIGVLIEFPQTVLVTKINSYTPILPVSITGWVGQDSAAGSDRFTGKFLPFIHRTSIIASMTDWKTKINQELDQAEAARRKGNEGQARVCARRAAGVAIREYYRRLDRPIQTPSAYSLLNHLMKEPGLPADLRTAAIHLTTRVTQEFELPVDVDLITEAKILCEGLLPELKNP